jgi:ABC-type nitrate/sulfonate/bicarbonate transport system permease component
VGQERNASREVLVDRMLPWAAVLLAIVLVELATRLDVIPQRFVPPPSLAFLALLKQVTLPGFWWAVWQTLWTWAASLAFACAIGIPLGIVLGTSPLLYRALRFVIEFLRPIPSVALIPAAILVIGVNYQSKIALAAFAAFWPVLINTIYGVQDVEPVALDTAKSFGRGPVARLTEVVLPYALPYIMTGLRIGSAVALIVVVTMEIVVGISGLGLRILEARQGANVEATYALILASGQLGWLLNTAFAVSERRLLHWHPSQRRIER